MVSRLDRRVQYCMGFPLVPPPTVHDSNGGAEMTGGADGTEVATASAASAAVAST